MQNNENEMNALLRAGDPQAGKCMFWPDRFTFDIDHNLYHKDSDTDVTWSDYDPSDEDYITIPHLYSDSESECDSKSDCIMLDNRIENKDDSDIEIIEDYILLDKLFEDENDSDIEVISDSDSSTDTSPPDMAEDEKSQSARKVLVFPSMSEARTQTEHF